MISKQATPRVLATAALIFLIAGLSGYSISAKTPESILAPALQLNGIQPVSARPITAMVFDDPEAVYEGARIVKDPRKYSGARTAAQWDPTRQCAANYGDGI